MDDQKDENEKENPFPDAHSVQSELYHSTVQIPANIMNSRQDEIKADSIIRSFRNSKDNENENKPIIQLEQLNEESHTCADVLCLIGSILILLASMITFIVVLTKGDMNALVVADSDGNLCGDNSIGSYPYLYMVVRNDSSVINGVCVSSCPNENNQNVSFFDISASSSEYNGLYESVGFENPRICVPINETLLDLLIDNLDFNSVNLIVDEIDYSLGFYWILFAFSIIVSIVLLILFRILKKKVVYFLVFLVIILLLCSGIGSIVFFSLSEEENIDNTQEWALTYFSFSLNYGSCSLYFGIFILCYSVFYFIQLIWYYKSGDLSKLSMLIKTAKDLNRYYKILWILGLIPFALLSMYFGFLCIFYIYLVPLYSSPEFSINPVTKTTSTEEIVFKIIAYITVPIALWIFACFLAFSQFCFAVLSVSKYCGVGNISIDDQRMRIFSNKLNYHIGSIFLAGFGIIIIFFSRLILGLLVAFGSVFALCFPRLKSCVTACHKLNKSISEKFSGNAFIIIALSNLTFMQSSEKVSFLLKKKYDSYKLEGDLGEILSHLCGLIVFCFNVILGLAFGFGKVDLKCTFIPLLVYAFFGYFCGMLMTQNYWYEINIIYILFCVHEDVFGKREEKQYNYENQIQHSKLNEIGGVYSIIKISRENEQFSQIYSQFN